MYTPGSGTYHHYLTAAQWRAGYAPSQRQVAAVTELPAGAGLPQHHGHRQPPGRHRRRHRRPGRACLLHRARQLPARREHGLRQHRRRPACRPALGTTVTGSHRPEQPAAQRASVRPSCSLPRGSPDLEGGLFPAQFETTYDATSARPPGTKTAVAILSEGDTDQHVISSLRYAEQEETPQPFRSRVVKVGPQSTDTAGADEFDMDSQVSTMVSGGVSHLYMYNIGSLVDAEVDADFAKLRLAGQGAGAVGEHRRLRDQLLPRRFRGLDRRRHAGRRDAGPEPVRLVRRQRRRVHVRRRDRCTGRRPRRELAGVRRVRHRSRRHQPDQRRRPATASRNSAGSAAAAASAASRTRAGGRRQSTRPSTPSTSAADGPCPDIALDADPNLATPVQGLRRQDDLATSAARACRRR